MNNEKLTTRQRILQAASRIVLQQGVINLTLENVALEAGLSKGGLLYHFPSKEALVEGLMQQLTEDFNSTLDRESGAEPIDAGRWLRAYVRMTFALDQQTNNLASGLLAAATMNPALLNPLRESFADWQARIEQDGIDPVVGTIIRLAADGLWLADLLEFAPPTGEIRQKVLDALLNLTFEGKT
jgi:AcrR family transcriptional regulator